MDENKLDLGTSESGVKKEISIEGESVIVKESFDAAPHLKYAEQARQSTDGKSWGNGRIIGHIPPAFYAKIIQIKDRDERDRAITEFFRNNKAFVTFDKYLKDL